LTSKLPSIIIHDLKSIETSQLMSHFAARRANSMGFRMVSGWCWPPKTKGPRWPTSVLLSVARSCKAKDSARMARPRGFAARPRRCKSQSTRPSSTSSYLVALVHDLDHFYIWIYSYVFWEQLMLGQHRPNSKIQWTSSQCS
jgi:hypothetical protein